MKNVKNYKKTVHKKKHKSRYSFVERMAIRYDKVKNALREDIDNPKSSFSVLEVVMIIFISIFFGIVIGYLITYNRGSVHNRNGSRIGNVIETYEKIVNDYYGKVDEDKLSEAAINGMIRSLGDPYSSYMSKEESLSFNEQTDGTFVGIGVTIQFDGEYNKVIDVYEKGPADKAGLIVDDVIIKVDGQDVKGLFGDNLSDLIRGKEGTDVKLTIKRGEEELDFTVTRGTVEIISVNGRVIESDDKKIGYLQVTAISSNTYTQFKKELKNIEKENINSLIIDLRNNLGGHLQQTKDILSMFFPKKTVLYQIETKGKAKKIYSDTKESRNYPVVVLINNETASAAEIIAICFQERYKDAVIMGNTSYGKGTVQKSESFSNGSTIKFTTQKWLSSKGKWVNANGVVPDILVNLDEKYYETLSDEDDNQLQEAIKKLKESSN